MSTAGENLQATVALQSLCDTRQTVTCTVTCRHLVSIALWFKVSPLYKTQTYFGVHTQSSVISILGKIRAILRGHGPNLEKNKTCFCNWNVLNHMTV